MTIQRSIRTRRLASRSVLPNGLLRLCSIIGFAALVACSPDVDPKVDESRSAGAARAPSLQSAALVVRSGDPRPSVILIVIDTLRADAVSTHGVVAGTTPTLDRLARDGVRYARAYAPAPWTTPSHASLFSGLRVDEHGVGLDGAHVVPDSIQMLAEDFSEAGYLTAGFSENNFISEMFGFEQGFDEFESIDFSALLAAIRLGESPPFPGLSERIRDWNKLRDRSLPFFLFINILDAHDPYMVRDENPWLSPNVRREEAEFIQSHYPVLASLCDKLPPTDELEILRGLYLGNVAAADAKLAEILRILDVDGDLDSHLMITTSDHGEHFGEDRLMGHRFSVGDPALHIPMIISGHPDALPTVIERPVALRQIRQSLLCWAFGESCPANLPIAKASSEAHRDPEDPIFSIYSDSVAELPKWILDQSSISADQRLAASSRSTCNAGDRVFGKMVSMIRYPMKITWFENYDPTLHDLSWDPKERFDQMDRQPQLALKLRTEIEAFVLSNIIEREDRALPELSEEGVRRLKSLGYVE
jgi:hypothetical protein